MIRALQILLLVVVSVSAADVKNENPLNCENYNRFAAMNPFDMTEFIKNDWYMNLFSLIAEPKIVRPPRHRCYYAAYNSGTDPLDYQIHVGFIRKDSTYITRNTSLTIQNEESRWKIWNFDIDSDFTFSVVLNTDYANWSLQYTCTLYRTTSIVKRVEYVSGYTRQREVGEQLKDYLKSLVSGYGFPTEPPMFGYMDHTNC